MNVVKLTSHQGNTLKKLVKEALPAVSKVRGDKNILFTMKRNKQASVDQQPKTTETPAYKVTLSGKEPQRNPNVIYNHSGKIVNSDSTH